MQHERSLLQNLANHVRALNASVVSDFFPYQLVRLVRVKLLRGSPQPQLHPDVRNAARIVQGDHRDVPNRRLVHLLQNAHAAGARDGESVTLENSRESNHKIGFRERHRRSVGNDDKTQRGVEVGECTASGGAAVLVVFFQGVHGHGHVPLLHDDDDARLGRTELPHGFAEHALGFVLHGLHAQGVRNVIGELAEYFRLRVVCQRFHHERIHEVAHHDTLLVLNHLSEDLDAVLHL
mmetsp:Transcript_3875/g.17844  ORF Transcript_3875/g.17844 Transcript_3875/m.17844 type:complete len:236 (+) Transcript_3875:2335-3042(+)